MKIYIQSSVLVETLSLLSKIPVKHPSLPEIEYIQLIVSAKKELEIIAHGVGISGRALIPLLEGSVEGVVIIDHSVLLGFLSSTQPGELVLELIDGVLKCTLGTSNAEIKTFNFDTMQKFPTFSGVDWYRGSSSTLIESIKKVSFACAQNDIRPEMSAIYITGKDGFLVTAATDGFYLAESKIQTIVSEDSSLLIPNKYTTDLIKVLGHLSQCSIQSGDGMIQVEVGNITLIIRVITGSYPAYEQIIPKEFNATMDTLKEDIKTALRIINPFTDPKFAKITLKPDQENGLCICETGYNEKGYGKSSFRGLMTGDLFDIRINPDNLMKILAVLPGDRVIFSFVDPSKPIVIHCPGDTSFRALLMPLGN